MLLKRIQEAPLCAHTVWTVLMCSCWLSGPHQRSNLQSSAAVVDHILTKTLLLQFSEKMQRQNEEPTGLRPVKRHLICVLSQLLQHHRTAPRTSRVNLWWSMTLTFHLCAHAVNHQHASCLFSDKHHLKKTSCFCCKHLSEATIFTPSTSSVFVFFFLTVGLNMTSLLVCLFVNVSLNTVCLLLHQIGSLKAETYDFEL